MNHKSLTSYFIKADKVDFLFILLTIIFATTSFYFMNAFITFFQNKLVASAKDFSSSDIRLESLKPFEQAQIESYDVTLQNSYFISQQVQFPTMLKSELRQEPFLANVKGVESTYPNYGKVLLFEQEYNGIANGTCYIAKDIQERYEIKVGENLFFGSKALKVSGIINELPDQSMLGPSTMIPTVLVSLKDAHESGLLKWGARVTYILLFKVKNTRIIPTQIEADANLLITKFEQDKIQVRTWQDSQSMGRSLFERSSAYFNLISYGSVILSVIGFFLAFYSLLHKLSNEFGLLYCLGVSREELYRSMNQLLFFFIVLGSICGLIIGVACEVFVFRRVEPHISIKSLLSAHGLLYLYTLIFGISTCWVLSFTLLRNFIYGLDGQAYKQASIAKLQKRTLIPFLLFVCFSLILFSGLHYGVWKPYFYLLGLIVLLGLILYIFSLFLFWLLRFVLSPFKIYPLAYLLDIEFFRNKNQFMPIYLALVFSTVFLIGIFSAYYAIENKLNLSNQPFRQNVFLIDLQKEQQAKLKELLDVDYQHHSLTLSPLVRANLIHINHATLSDLKKQAKAEGDFKKQNFLNRGYNLTYKEELNSSEKIVKGQFWQKGEEHPHISVEADFAKTLNLKIGDVMSFDVGGFIVDGEISSIRSIDWGSMNPNFFIVLPTHILSMAPQTIIASCYVPSAKKIQFQKQLSQVLPNVSVINVDELLHKISQLFTKVKNVLLVTAVLCFVSSLLILFIGLFSNETNQQTRCYLWRSVGLTQNQISWLLIGERGYFLASVFIGLFVLGFLWNQLLAFFMKEPLPIMNPAVFGLMFVLILIEIVLSLVKNKKAY